MKAAVKPVEIAGRRIGHGHPCFIIAEAGVNHNGDVELAKRLNDIAFEAGADAVKFQTFKADQVVSSKAPKAEYQKRNTIPSETHIEMLHRLELSWEAHRELQAYCEKQGIVFMSTPFDRRSVDLLDGLDVPAFKIGSGEITNLPFLDYVARKGKPILLSTGMSEMSEVDEAVRLIRNTGNDQLILLHCVSNYPADPGDANLRAIQTMANAFQVPVGYSDHTLGNETVMAAVALGACVIEKHFTLDKKLPGPDHRASVDPYELKTFIKGVKTVERALGNGVKQPARSEAENRLIVRRSLAAACDIPKGVVIELDMLVALRPATGISPVYLQRITGRRLIKPIKSGQLISWKDLG